VTIITKILGSLLEKYNALITAWDSVERGNQMLDNLGQHLIKEEARMTAIDEASDALTAMSLKMKKTQQRTKERKPHSKRDSVECYYCYKPGHYIKNCRKKKRDEDRGIRDEGRHERRNSESNIRGAFLAEATETDFRKLAPKDVWLLDSVMSRFGNTNS